jgi:hypothetical protein
MLRSIGALRQDLRCHPRHRGRAGTLALLPSVA